MRRRNVLLLVLGMVVLSAGTTWIASAQIRSQAEVAARTAPPAPSPILVPVESKDIYPLSSVFYARPGWTCTTA